MVMLLYPKESSSSTFEIAAINFRNLLAERKFLLSGRNALRDYFY